MINKKIIIIGSLALSLILGLSLFFIANKTSNAEETQQLSLKANSGKIKDVGNLPKIMISTENITNLLKEFDKRYKSEYSWKNCVIDKMKQHENITIIYVYCDFPTSKIDKAKLPKSNPCQPLFNDNNIERCNISMKWLMSDAEYYKIVK